MANGILQKLSDALLGTAQTVPLNNNNSPHSPGVQNYLDSLGDKPFMQNLLNQPKQTGLTLDQYKEGFTQGLNFGVPELAEAQKVLGINTPKTEEEKEQARQGTFNSYPLQAGLSTTPRQGGILSDFFSGYRENYDNAFDPSNWTPQNKNFATRAGELLGSVGRFVDSPLGRGLIAAGLNKAMGYDNSLQEGLTAYVGRQDNQTTDKLYRNQLKKLGFSDEELGNIKGNVTENMFKNLVGNMYKFRNLDQNTYMKMKTAYDRQLQQGIMTPEEYQANVDALNNQYVNSQIQTMQAGNVQKSNQTLNTEMNQQLLPYKQYALQMSPQIAMGNFGVAQGNLALRNAEFNYKQYQDALENSNPKIDPKTKLALRDKTDALTQIQELRKLVNNNPNATGLVIGSLAKGKELSQKIANANSTSGQIQTRAGIAKLRGTTMHDLAGTAQTLQEQRNLAPFLPDATDDVRTINAKLDQLEAELTREYNSIYNAYGGNIGVIQQPTQQNQGVTSSGVKYKVVN